MMYENRALLKQLRDACLRAAPDFTWKAAGVKLLEAYREAVAARHVS
jgi:hypothetical protein